jgi:hydroxypyruvate reductase
MRDQALAIFNAAVSAVQPSCLLPKHIRVDHNMLWLNERSFSLEEHGIYVIGAGKASAAMAVEIEKILGDHIIEGIVVTKYGHGLPLKKIKCREADHPLPDENGVLAAKEIMSLVNKAGEKDIIIALICGGASSLLADYPPETSLAALQNVFQLLLECGATIHEINTVRKHLSLIKGGQLARAAYPATVVSFILSDVIGDPLDVIASGPTVADPTSFEDALAVISKYDLSAKIHPGIMAWMQKGLNEEIEDTPKPGNQVFDKTFNHLIGTNRIALAAAAEKAKELGFAPFIITDRLCGEADEEAKKLIDYLMMYRSSKPACILMGGETTVTIKGKGKGGRNQQFALAALNELVKNFPFPGKRKILILSAGTDGSDGATDATGAWINEETIKEAEKNGLDISSFLNDNDAYNFFKKVGGLIITGPTQTNVMDVVIALVE